MKRSLPLLLAALCFAIATPLLAQTRTWVSGVGNDANPCSRTAPCKTFAGAISKTAANGEINVIDSGGYGAVTITKSITIDGSGAHASILASGVTGIIVNGANIVVNLRNLSINGVNTTAGSGVRILNAAAVNIDNVAIANFAGSGTVGRGVSIETTVANLRVAVSNSFLFNNNNPGIHAVPSAGNAILTVDNTQISRGGTSGIQLGSNTTATIARSAMTQHRNGAGVALETSTSAQISNSIMSNNAFGIQHTAGGTQATFLYDSTVTGNTTAGLQIGAGTITSLGNNIIRGNTGNQTPSSTITPQ